MRKSLMFALMIVLLNSSCAAKRQYKILDEVELPARPVAQLMLAVQENDTDLFENVWSERMCAVIEREEGMRERMRVYKELFSEKLGKYRLRDFNFTFSGDEQSVYVKTLFKGRELPELYVIKEDSEWKIDEK